MLDKYKMRKILKIMITILLPIYLLLMIYYIPGIFIFSIILRNTIGILTSIVSIVIALLGILAFLKLYDLL